MLVLICLFYPLDFRIKASHGSQMCKVMVGGGEGVGGQVSPSPNAVTIVTTFITPESRTGNGPWRVVSCQSQISEPKF